MSSRLLTLSMIAALFAARSVSGVCAGSIKFETAPFACCALEGDGVYHVIVSSNIAPASVQYVVGPSHDFDHPDTNMYTQISGTLSFATGETTKTIDVPLLNDDDWEPPGWIYVTIRNPSGACINNSPNSTDSRFIRWGNDDAQPLIAFDTPIPAQRNEGDGPLTVNLSRSQNIAGHAGLTWTASTTLGGNLVQMQGTAMFTPRQSTTSFTIPFTDDQIYDGNRTYTLYFQGTNGSVFTGDHTSMQTQITILENDPPPMLSIDDISVNEGDNGTTNAVFTVSTPSTLRQTTYINYSVMNGSATLGSDFNGPSSGQLTLQPGQTSAQIVVQVVGDTNYEPSETFSVVISSPGTPITKATGIATILNDDSQSQTLTFSSDAISLTPGASSDVFVAVTPPSGSPMTLVVSAMQPGVVLVPSTVDINSTGTGVLSIKALGPGTTTIVVTLGSTDYFLQARVTAPARRRGVSH